MKRTFAILCPPISGCLHPMVALGAALVKRGHRVVMVTWPGDARVAEGAALECFSLAEPTGPGFRTLPFRIARRLLVRRSSYSRLTGWRTVMLAFEAYAAWSRRLLQGAPAVLERVSPDLLIAPQQVYAASTVAEQLGRPFATICLGVPRNREPGLPPWNSPSEPSSTRVGRAAHDLGWQLLERLSFPVLDALNRHRGKLGMAGYRKVEETYSPWLQVSQLPKVLDFPRRDACLHQVGPLVGEASRVSVPFPWERLTGRPLIYCAFGTMSDVPHLLRATATACASLEADLVLSAGWAHETLSDGLQGNPIVVRSAPQLQLLSRAALCINHGGTNTVLESVPAGVPQLIVPLAVDQPGAGSRIAWASCGKVLPPRSATPDAIFGAASELLRPHWAERVREVSRACADGIAPTVRMLEETAADTA